MQQDVQRRPVQRRLVQLIAGTTLLVGACMVANAVGIPPLAANGLLHPGRRPVGQRPPAPCAEVSFLGSGVTLKGRRCQAAGEQRGTLVFLHGVADNRASVADAVDRFLVKQLDVVAYDSRAQGEWAGDVCTYGYWEKRDLARVLNTVRPGPMVVSEHPWERLWPCRRQTTGG